MQDKSTDRYFQYRPELGMPIFVKVANSVLEDQLSKIFEEFGFEKCSEDIMNKSYDGDQTLRVLKISFAVPSVAKQIGNAREEDKYGLESISTRGDYSVYRFKGVGLMVLSAGRPVWELGLMNRFHDEKYHYQLRALFHRFLSYTLLSYGIIGVWGATVEEGVVLMTQQDSKGEAVFIDMNNQTLHTIEGVKPMHYPLQVLKLDQSFHDKARRIQIEQLVSYLSHYNTYFSLEGFSSILRREILNVAQFSEGTYYPAENFVPRNEDESAS